MPLAADSDAFRLDLIAVGALLVADRAWLTDDETVSLAPVLERLLKTEMPLTESERRRVNWIRRAVDLRQGPHYVAGGLPGSGR
jgi:hypothetical protein